MTWPTTNTKYGNRKVEVDGFLFDSKREANRYSELRLMQMAGVITELECQPRFDLYVNDAYLGFYRGDFRYVDRKGNIVVEDVKGVRTPVYRLKKKLMKAIHSIDVVEI